jgi:hypothetical protein
MLHNNAMYIEKIKLCNNLRHNIVVRCVCLNSKVLGSDPKFSLPYFVFVTFPESCCVIHENKEYTQLKTQTEHNKCGGLVAGVLFSKPHVQGSNLMSCNIFNDLTHKFINVEI